MGYRGHKPPEEAIPPGHPFSQTQIIFGQKRPNATSETLAPQELDDPNRPETEEDGLRAGALRRLKAQRQSEAFIAQTRGLSPSPGVVVNPEDPLHDAMDELKRKLGPEELLRRLSELRTESGSKD